MASGGTVPAPGQQGGVGGSHVMAIVPPNADTRLGDFRPIIRASEEASFYRETQAAANIKRGAVSMHEVSIVQDADLGTEAVDLVGEGVSLDIAVKCTLPYLVLQVRDLEMFTSITLTLVDSEKRIRRYTVGNKQTITRVKGDTASAPLLLVPGWNLVLLDLPSIMQEAFGATHAYCKKITVNSSLRLGRVFFQDALYEDSELPSFLRVLA